MGRNKELKEPLFVGCNIEHSDLEELDKIRWREHKERSEIIRIAVKEFIKIHGSGNDTFKITDFHDPDFRAMPAFMSPTPKWTEFIIKHTDRKERDEIYKQADYIRMMARSENHREEMGKK
jgi:hypothetical protein